MMRDRNGAHQLIYEISLIFLKEIEKDYDGCLLNGQRVFCLSPFLTVVIAT